MKYQDETAFEKVNMFGKGMPNDAFAQYFVGNSYLNALRPEQLPGEPGAFNVTFEPGCRNNWHIHHAASGGGQILVCAAGEGWFQEWGSDPVSPQPRREQSPGPRRRFHWLPG